MERRDILVPLRIGSLYIASIIGAGFASGKEIFLFFSHFEYAGIVGIFIAGSITSVLGYIVMITSRNRNILGVRELLDLFYGRFSGVVEFLIGTFVFIVFAVMLAGSGQIVSRLALDIGEINIIPQLCSFMILLLVYGILLKGDGFIQQFTVFVMCFLLIGIVYFSVFMMVVLQDNMARCMVLIGAVAVESTIRIFPSLLYESIGYCGYNGMLSLNTLIEIAKKRPTDRQIFWGSIVAGILFIILSGMMNHVLINFQFSWLEKQDFPFVEVINLVNSGTGSVYKLIILLAMFMSMTINGFFLFAKSKIFPLLACLFVFLGFSGIIIIFYPVYGFFGIILIIFLIIRYFVIK